MSFLKLLQNYTAMLLVALARQAAAVPVAILLDRLQWRAPRAPAASVLRCGSLTGLLGCSGTARQRDSFNIARGLAAHTWQTSVVRGFRAHLNTLGVFFPVHKGEIHRVDPTFAS